MLFQCDNYGFSVPVVSRNCVPALTKGATIACEARLAVNVDKLTEPVIITLKEHWHPVYDDVPAIIDALYYSECRHETIQ